MTVTDQEQLAHELMAAYANRQELAPPSARDAGFALDDAYAVEAALARVRRASGRRTVGRKVGFANKAMWRVLRLETLVWAHMYDDTVRMAEANAATLPLGRMCAPKIEPEIVFKLRAPIGQGVSEPAAVLEAVEWLALGFEIIDCPFADWTFQPVDFVAAFGFHAALVIGEPLAVTPDIIPALVDRLPRFAVRLAKDGALVDEGSGRNSLRSPALCLGELASAVARRPGQEPLAAGDLVSSGTLTTSQPIAPGETWTATLDGLDLPALTLQTTM